MHRPPTPHFFSSAARLPIFEPSLYPIPSHCSPCSVRTSRPPFRSPALFLPFSYPPHFPAAPCTPPRDTPPANGANGGFLVRGLQGHHYTFSPSFSTPALPPPRQCAQRGCFRVAGLSTFRHRHHCFAPHLPAPRPRCDKISIHRQHSQHQQETSRVVLSLRVCNTYRLSFALQATNISLNLFCNTFFQGLTTTTPFVH